MSTTIPEVNQKLTSIVFFYSFFSFPLSLSGITAAMAGVFAATDAAVANVRETKDAWNSVAA